MFDWILKRSAFYCENLMKEAPFEAKRELARLVKEKGWQFVYEWTTRNLPLVKEYLALPQRQRGAKKWQKHKPLLYLSAYVLCRLGEEFVKRTDCLSTVSETRNALAVAGEQALEVIFSVFEELEGFVLDFFDGFPDDYLY